ncbi:14980_t:CDS:1, partial [Dentiscutata erythropus]
MSFSQNLRIQNIFPPRFNDPDKIVDMLPNHFNSKSVTSYGVFRERLEIKDSKEINAVT